MLDPHYVRNQSSIEVSQFFREYFDENINQNFPLKSIDEAIANIPFIPINPISDEQGNTIIPAGKFSKPILITKDDRKHVLHVPTSMFINTTKANTDYPYFAKKTTFSDLEQAIDSHLINEDLAPNHFRSIRDNTFKQDLAFPFKNAITDEVALVLSDKVDYHLKNSTANSIFKEAQIDYLKTNYYLPLENIKLLASWNAEYLAVCLYQAQTPLGTRYFLVDGDHILIGSDLSCDYRRIFENLILWISRSVLLSYMVSKTHDLINQGVFLHNELGNAEYYKAVNPVVANGVLTCLLLRIKTIDDVMPLYLESATVDFNKFDYNRSIKFRINNKNTQLVFL